MTYRSIYSAFTCALNIVYKNYAASPLGGLGSTDVLKNIPRYSDVSLEIFGLKPLRH